MHQFEYFNLPERQFAQDTTPNLSLDTKYKEDRLIDGGGSQQPSGLPF